jgi:hypothetical protein
MSLVPSLINRVEAVLLTLWVGGMWFVGFVAAPVLFNVLESRQMAGMVAGHLFSAVHYVGLVCGGLLLIFMLIDKVGVDRRRLRIWLLAAMLFIIAVNQFAIQPVMASLKLEGLVEGSETAIQFGRMHGISSLLYLLCSLLGLLLLMWHDVGNRGANGARLSR